MTGTARASKSMNGNRLFGDADGKYSSGYEKLAQLDVDGNGALSGAELQGLKVWQDNGDAKVQAGEMKSLAEVGVDQISVQRQDAFPRRDLNAIGCHTQRAKHSHRRCLVRPSVKLAGVGDASIFRTCTIVQVRMF